MSRGNVSFGYVVQTVPPGFTGESMSASEATRELVDATDRCIEFLRPYFDTVWVEDHLQWDKRPVLEAITALTYYAGRHEGLRYGNIVLCQSFRNPALLAKMAAIMQVLTKGNFILGIGAGWKEDEYLAYGYDYPSPGSRVEQLEEAVTIVRAMWAQGQASFEGKHYRIENAECQPQPRPAIPILIGGGGEQKTLRVAAKHADWWTAPVQSIEEYGRKQRLLEERCREVGRDPWEITHAFCARLDLVDDASKFQRRPGRYIIGGDADAVSRELEELIGLGVKHFQLSFMDFPRTDMMGLFVEKVLPRLADKTALQGGDA